MARFHYTGRTPNGESASGVIEAADAQAVARQLSGRSITPVAIKLEQDAGTSVDKINWLTRKTTLPDLVIFCRQMYSLTKAGIPIMRAVTGLADSSSSLRLKMALSDVVSQLERGRTLSSALSQHKTIFNQLFVSVIHVGENTGQLDSAFLQLSEYLEREQETRKQIKAATRYPLFVIVAIAIALVIMNIFVIPQFAAMFSRFNAELPVMTRFLIGMSDFFVHKWYVLVIATVAIVWGSIHYVNTEKGRYNWDKAKIKLPIIGSILERSILGRFSRSFAMMLKAGVPLTASLTLVSDAVNNSFMGSRILIMRQNIERGENLSRVAQTSELFTPMVLQMISVGEETGQVDELLSEVASFYEREVDYDLKSLTSKIEPILIAIVAAMVLVLALGIFTPMWDLMGAIQGR
ncbi:type II secretion system F family protein [Alteromonas sp. 5E99-2]|uniref:type II secretion system F family protein n=1 Tax=Alteromonas sp. 5E99-2 TaxID=2817683 RepID=UPI001A9A0FAF|nr:type II secretion system F family protein [Alteromonas sp. 5E99-2]MBO1255845.1 type II secretion system F family protein [Alteromonas sp. 5E99-2]